MITVIDDRAIMWNITQQQIMELRHLNMSVSYKIIIRKKSNVIEINHGIV